MRYVCACGGNGPKPRPRTAKASLELARALVHTDPRADSCRFSAAIDAVLGAVWEYVGASEKDANIRPFLAAATLHEEPGVCA